MKRLRDRFFAGKVAIVTGGTRGLGLVLARELLARGASVALCARDGNEVAAAHEELAYRGPLYVAQCDVTDAGQVKRFVADVHAHYERIDVLINDAGTIVGAPCLEMTPADLRRVMEVNFFGAVNAMQAIVPYMRAQRCGNIVNVTSAGAPHLFAYCSATFALNGFSEAVRAEIQRERIRLTVVNPGLIRTGSALNATFKGRTGAERAWFSVSDALPFVSMRAERAARLILRACKRGEPSVMLSLPGKLAALLHAVSPSLFIRLTTLANAFLPLPELDPERYALTAASDRAAHNNNEFAA